MSNIDAEARERGAQLTARIAQRAVIGAKLAEALRRLTAAVGPTRAMSKESLEARAFEAARAFEEARVALAEWDAQS